MPQIFTPQAPFRLGALQQQQPPPVTFNQGGGQDVALLLSLIDLLQRRDERSDRTSLDRELIDLQKGRAGIERTGAEAALFGQEVSSLGGQVGSIRQEKQERFARSQDSRSRDLGKKLTKGARSVELLSREIQRLPSKTTAGVEEFLSRLPERVEAAIGRENDPLGKIGAGHALNQVILGFAQSGQIHSDRLLNVYDRELTGLSEFSAAALPRAGGSIPTVIEDSLASRGEAFSEFLNTGTRGVQESINAARASKGDRGLLNQAFRASDAFNTRRFTEPAVTFSPTPSVRKGPDLSASPTAVRGAGDVVGSVPEAVRDASFGLVGGLSTALFGGRTGETPGGEPTVNPNLNQAFLSLGQLLGLGNNASPSAPTPPPDVGSLGGFLQEKTQSEQRPSFPLFDPGLPGFSPGIEELFGPPSSLAPQLEPGPRFHQPLRHLR